MAVYAPTVTEFWRSLFLTGDIVLSTDRLTVASNPALPNDRRGMLLETANGTFAAVLTPALVTRLDLTSGRELTESILREKLAAAGIQLHGADCLFYVAAADKAGLLEDDAPPEVRQLTEDDRTAFAEFQAAASAADLDAAFVELDHWAAFGAFEQGHLVCAASAYPWGGARIADIGVLSLAPFRGRGHARNVVRSLSRYALAQGYEPQYRCQLDNQASVALAGAAGLSLFGTWDVVASESAD